MKGFLQRGSMLGTQHVYAVSKGSKYRLRLREFLAKDPKKTERNKSVTLCLLVLSLKNKA